MNHVIGFVAAVPTADPRLSPEANPLPFDGKRPLYGGFQGIASVRSAAASRPGP